MLEELKEFYESRLCLEMQQLQKQRKELVRNTMLATGLFGALGLLFGWIAIGQRAAPIVLIFILIGGLIGGGIYFAAASKKYKQAFKQKIIGALVRFIEPGLNYQPDGFIDKHTFDAAGIFNQHIDRYRGEDLVTGIVGKTRIAFSEVHAEYKTTTRTRNGHTQNHWHTIFKGLFFTADFNKHFRGRTVVLPDTAEKLLGGFGRMLQAWNIARADLIKLEDPEFEREFVVYGEDQIEARYILSTSLMQRILDFQKKTGTKISLSFGDSKLYAAVPMARNLFEPPYFSSSDKMERIEEYYRDLALAVGIVDDLNLNTRIWSKE